MSQHDWGDKSFDWSALNGAISEIRFWGNKVGRIGGDLKEKWGEVRWYVSLGRVEKVSDLVFPGYVYYQWRAEHKPFMNIIDQISSVYMRPFKNLIAKYKRFMYGLAYHRATKKYPHIAAEILDCAEHPELLFNSERKLYENIWKSEESNDDD